MFYDACQAARLLSALVRSNPASILFGYFSLFSAHTIVQPLQRSSNKAIVVLAFGCFFLAILGQVLGNPPR